MIQVLPADEYLRPRYENMIDKVIGIIKGLNSTNIDLETLDSVKIYVDACKPRILLPL